MNAQAWTLEGATVSSTCACNSCIAANDSAGQSSLSEDKLGSPHAEDTQDTNSENRRTQPHVTS